MGVDTLHQEAVFNMDILVKAPPTDLSRDHPSMDFVWKVGDMGHGGGMQETSIILAMSCE